MASKMSEKLRQILGLGPKKLDPTKISDLMKSPDSDWFSYEFTLKHEGQTAAISIGSSIPIRNHETLLRGFDEIIFCEKGHSLQGKPVVFSVNGSGKTLRRSVLYCPQCDKEPPDSAPLFASMDNALIFI